MEFLLRGCCNGPQSSVQVVIVIYCGTREPPPPPHSLLYFIFPSCKRCYKTSKVGYVQ